MTTILLTIHIMIAVALVGVVLLQRSEGGALGIGVGDHVNMLEYSTYTVISPEGCANILWKSSEKAEIAAEAMGVTSLGLERLKIVDETIKEPLGGAHRDMEKMCVNLKIRLAEQLIELKKISTDDLIARRYDRLMNYGSVIN